MPAYGPATSERSLNAAPISWVASDAFPAEDHLCVLDLQTGRFKLRRIASMFIFQRTIRLRLRWRSKPASLQS